MTTRSWARLAAVLLLGLGIGACRRGGAPPSTDRVQPPLVAQSASPDTPPQAPAPGPRPSGALPSTAPLPSTREAPRPCPQHMEHIANYCIDRYEAHLVDAETGEKHPHNERPDPARSYRAQAEPAAFPQGYVNRPEAEQACQNAGKRLCTLAEWYRACSGPQALVYPYGSEYQAQACNEGKAHLLSRLFGADPKLWSYDDHFNSPKLNLEPGFLARAGAYEACVSAEGVFDLVGNLHEWVSDRVDYDLPGKIPLQADIAAKIGSNFGKGIFMGGFYSTTNQHGKGCRFLTPGHGPRYHDYSTGFRCCQAASSD